MSELIKKEEGIIDPEVINKITEREREKRKAAEQKKTPEQYKGKVPMGGALKPYVKDKYMRDELKSFCNELYWIDEPKFWIDKFELPRVDANGNVVGTYVEYWVSCSLVVTDRSSGNRVPGVGSAMVKINKAGNIVNLRHDYVSAETSAIKDAAKNFGIASDVYGKDVTEISEDLQNIINEAVPFVEKKYGADKAKIFIEKIESLLNGSSKFPKDSDTPLEPEEAVKEYIKSVIEKQ